MTSYYIPRQPKENPMTTADAFKAAGWTFLFSFIALFLISSLGWLADVVSWASSSGASAFPDLSVLGYAAVSAVASAAIGLVNFVIRYAQSKGVFGENAAAIGPNYTNPDA